MKKIIIFLVSGLFIALFAKIDDKYLQYARAIVHYHFELKDFNKIKPPFEERIFITNNKKNKFLRKKEKSIKIILISILNNKAYILVDKYLDNNLIKSYKKWVKKGDVIEKSYKVQKILLDKVIFKYKNKVIIKTFNKNLPGLKEK